jgi:hypothetical protein
MRLERGFVLASVAANIAVYAASFAFAVWREPGKGFFARASMLFTDELPVPCNVWTCTFHFPATLLASSVLGGIQKRESWMALAFPQITFLLVSSLQTALVAWLVLRIVRRAAE